MLPVIIPAVLGIASLIANQKIAEDNRKMQQEANEQARLYYLEDREYNSPANQKKRLQDAGLNPAFYMDGVGTTSPQSYDIKTTPSPYVDLTKTFSDILSSTEIDARTKETEISTRLKELNADELSATFTDMLGISSEKLELLKKQSSLLNTEVAVAKRSEEMFKELETLINKLDIEDLAKQLHMPKELLNVLVLGFKSAVQGKVLSNTFDKQ